MHHASNTITLWTYCAPLTCISWAAGNFHLGFWVFRPFRPAIFDACLGVYWTWLALFALHLFSFFFFLLCHLGFC